MEGLTKLEKAEWPAKQDKISLCITKGQSEKDCRNFVKVLVSHQDQLLACGTYSFSPKCSWRPIEAIRQVTEYVDGRGKCPYNPRANASAYMNRWTQLWRFQIESFAEKVNIGIVFKGGFYSEGTDAFVISSNRQTLYPELEFWNCEILKGSNHVT